MPRSSWRRQRVDLLLHVPARLPDGRRGRRPMVGPGGTAANTARGLAALGVPTRFAGAVGDDAFGRQAAEDLVAAGVDTSGLIVAGEAATCRVIALVEPDGERSLVVWPPDGGALRWLRPRDVPPEAIAGAAWLHTTGMCLRDPPVRDTVLAAMAEARAAGVPVSIDLNLRVELWGLDATRRAIVEQAVALADVVLGSGPEELLPLAAALGASATTVEAAAAALAGGARTIVARLGGQGALACDAAGVVSRSAGFAVEVRNVIGAGDAFNAGFIAARVEGRPIDAALAWGNATAALHVARDKGSSPPTRAEVEALVR
ncbi:MAG: carbohydrate kinase family protein [Chloroflexota bacterium]